MWYSNSLRAVHSGVRTPVGARFAASFETSPGAHPAFCTMSTVSFFPGVKRPEGGVDHPPLPSAEVVNKLYPYSPLPRVFMAC
jgi:hypothetical protein